MTDEPVTDAILTQAGTDLVTLTNRQRTTRGLVALQADPDLMRIARDRARVMAANDLMSHTEPDGRKVWDRIDAAGLTWYSAGEILAWNRYPTSALSTAAAVVAWMGSPTHHAIMVSTGYNYVGFGAAVSAGGRRYYAGVYVKEPDETGAWSRLGTVSRQAVTASRVRVTVRWSGADTRLQVLTAGLRDFQVHWRQGSGSWHSWSTTTSIRHSVTWTKGSTHEVRVRARDRVGNWGAWRTVRIKA